MNSFSYDPYGRPRARARRPSLQRLLAALLLVTGVALIGIVSLPAGIPGKSGQSVPVRRVSRLVYPAVPVREFVQPADGGWLMPAAVVTAGDATFVLDTGNNRVLKLDAGGRVVAAFDAASDPQLVLRQPMAMATDGRRLFIANSLAGQVVVTDLAGRVERVIALEAGGTPSRPIGVAVTPGGDIVVSDADNQRVLILDGEGRWKHTAGGHGRAAGAEGFNVPGALSVDAAGAIYVVDTLNGRVVKLSPDGAFIREYGRPGDAAGTLSRPKGVAVDAAGRVFVSDGLQAAVEVFARDGAYLGLIGRSDPGDVASGSLFQAPAGLWLAGDRLYVIDRMAGLAILRLSTPPP